MPLENGALAPDFVLRDQHGQEFRLSSFQGSRSVLVVFFPYAFSSVCTGELLGIRDRLGEVETDDSTVVAISCDPTYSLRALADRDALFFPLLSDFWPHGAVGSAYDVFDKASGSSLRSSYVVDKAGRVAWSVHAPWGEARDLGLQARALAGLV